LEGIQNAVDEDLYLAIGSNTMELMPNEVRQGDSVCRIRFARRQIFLRLEMDGYRFVIALPPKYGFEEYLGHWNGWPKGLKRNVPKRQILTRWSNQVVIGFRMTPTYVETDENSGRQITLKKIGI
jgi:hypothetical protein